jgi:hypothetical protein
MRDLFALALALVGSSPAWAQQSVRPQGVPAVEKFEPKSLTLSPAPEPVPALKYRFLPSSAELTAGDAAPVYLRIRHEQSDEAMNQIKDKTIRSDGKGDGWLEIPLKELPVVEARKFVTGWEGKLRQIRFGAWRAHCDWNYTLPEQRLDSIGILLPDAQEMRRWALLLALKARVEIAEGKLEEAIETIETGLAFGRHVGSGPFLVNRLVGIAICQMMLDRAEELVSQPGAPNVYWALTVLPQPMVDLRSALETEEHVTEYMVPELNEIEGSHTNAEWAVLLDRLLDRLGKLTISVTAMSSEGPNQTLMKQLEDAWKHATMKQRLLADARKTLAKGRGWTETEVDSMSDDEAVARYILATYREVRDTAFRATYVSYASDPGKALDAAADAALKRVKGGPLGLFAEIIPAVRQVQIATMRLDRRIAALRVVEAIRMQAAANGGKLPETLSAITVVPVPDDPATGKPFSYTVKEGVADVAAGRLDNQPKSEVGYRLTIRP